MHPKDPIPTRRDRLTGRLASLMPLALLMLLLLSWACGSPEQVPEAPADEPAAEAPADDSSSDPPARSDTITAISQFLSCKGNPYALCYYSGPEDAPPNTVKPVPALPCTLGPDGHIANCKCYAQQDGLTVNYVALPSILDPDVREENETACGPNGRRCLNMLSEKTTCADNPDAEHCKPAPVCDDLGNVEAGTGQSFYPEGTLISTFSFVHSQRYPIHSTACDSGITYAGCMTAGCGEPYTEHGETFVDCACPTYDKGPFQFGQKNDALSCDLGGDNVWSAANLTVSIPHPESSDG